MSHKVNLGNKSHEQSCEIHPNLVIFSGYDTSRCLSVKLFVKDVNHR